jgi:hypothetical protein
LFDIHLGPRLQPHDGELEYSLIGEGWDNDNDIAMVVDMLTWFGFGDIDMNVATSTEGN